MLYAAPFAGASVEQDLGQLASKYKIEILTANESFPATISCGRIDAREPTATEIAPYAPLLVFEFGIYPTQFIEHSQLKKIVLCCDLSYNGQRRNAVPDLEHNVLYLDVRRGNYSLPYLRKVIHHEFFHMIDWLDDYNLYADTLWSKLNPGGFAYGSGGKNRQGDLTVSQIDRSTQGFLNAYSRSAVEEDKAEIFANLIVHYRYMEDLAARDAVICSKMQFILKLLQKFSPDMNGEFWSSVEARSIALSADELKARP